MGHTKKKIKEINDTVEGKFKTLKRKLLFEEFAISRQFMSFEP